MGWDDISPQILSAIDAPLGAVSSHQAARLVSGCFEESTIRQADSAVGLPRCSAGHASPGPTRVAAQHDWVVVDAWTRRPFQRAAVCRLGGILSFSSLSPPPSCSSVPIRLNCVAEFALPLWECLCRCMRDPIGLARASRGQALRGVSSPSPRRLEPVPRVGASPAHRGINSAREVWPGGKLGQGRSSPRCLRLSGRWTGVCVETPAGDGDGGPQVRLLRLRRPSRSRRFGQICA